MQEKQQKVCEFYGKSTSVTSKIVSATTIRNYEEEGFIRMMSSYNVRYITGRR